MIKNNDADARDLKELLISFSIRNIVCSPALFFCLVAYFNGDIL